MGCNFLMRNIPDEVFIYQRHSDPEYRFPNVDPCIFPYLLVNIGSGVSIMKVCRAWTFSVEFCQFLRCFKWIFQVESEDQYERIGGTATGGGTFWGLGSLLTKAKVGENRSFYFQRIGKIYLYNTYKTAKLLLFSSNRLLHTCNMLQDLICQLSHP